MLSRTPRLFNRLVASSRRTSVVGAFALACALAVPGISAATASAAVEDGLVYTVDGDNATITNCAFGVCPEDLVIPSTIGGKTVTSLVGFGPSNASSIKSVSLPSTLTTLGYAAFLGYSNLESIDIPGSVSALPDYMFNLDRKLSSVTLHEGLKTIGFAVFANTNSLTSLSIPSTVTAIGPYGLGAIPDVTFNGNAPTVADDAQIDDAPGATATIASSSLTGYGADGDNFHGLTVKLPPVVSFTVADGEATITGCAAGVCPSSLVIPSSINGTPVTKIGAYAFYYQPTLDAITLPDSITSIGNNAFEGAEKLKSIVIPSGVTAIQNATFQDAHGLASITLPAGLTSIGGWAFDRAYSLTRIKIPSTVTSFGPYAFHDANKLKGIIFKGNAPSVGVQVFLGIANYSGSKALLASPDLTGFGEIGDDFHGLTVATLDETAVPDAPALSGAPNALTASSGASISFSGEEGASFTCSVDGGDYADCDGSPKVLTSLSDGDHSLSVKQTNAFTGNTSEAATASWTVDTTGPAAPVALSDSDPMPSGVVNKKSITIKITGEGGGFPSFLECSKDGADYSRCGTLGDGIGITTMYDLQDGPHSFKVREVDPLGNVGEVASYEWTVDTTAPNAPVLTGAPGAVATATDASIGFSGEDNAAFTCSVDGGDYEACGASPKVLSDLSEGEHSLSVKQTDAAGNVSGAATASWTVINKFVYTVDGDNATITNCAFGVCPEDLVIPSTIGGKTVTSLVGFGPSNASSIKSVSLPSTLTTLGYAAFLGYSNLESIDIPGSVSALPDYMFNLDRKLSSVTLHEGLKTIGFAVFANTNSLTSLSIPSTVTAIGPYGLGAIPDVTFNGNAPTVADDAQIVDAPVGTATLASPSLTGYGYNGASFHGLTVSGGVDAPPADTAAPAAPTITTSSVASGVVRPSIVFAPAEQGGTIECKLNAGVWAACSSPFAPSADLAVGDYTFRVRQTDAAGNVSDAASFSFHVSVPVVTPSQPFVAVGFPVAPSWFMQGHSGHFQVNVPVSTGGDTRGAAQPLSLQISTIAHPDPRLPSRASRSWKVVKYSASFTWNGNYRMPPRWIRVGTKAGKWSDWTSIVKRTQP